MKNLQTFRVLPDIPEPLKFLETLSRNIWWCWHHDAIDLFRRIDPRLWDECERNPILFLTRVPQSRLEELAKDTSFLTHKDRVKEIFQDLPCNRLKDYDTLVSYKGAIAYFSMEFGIHESIPLFAGGLGILAGDHLKASSDMEMPLVGIGLLYRQGYFRQFLNQEGWQQEEYPETDIYLLPMKRATNAKGDNIRITITGPEGEIHAAVWRLNVGCVPLYLLDTNLPENTRKNRDITSRLYIGDPKMRVSQEMILGIGGMRALKKLGIEPAVCHMNEGHSAFSSLERIAQIMDSHNVDFKTALEIVPRTTVFTTHTPVAAGNEEFSPDLLKPYLIHLEKRLGISVDEMLSFGKPGSAGSGSPFYMFVLGAKMAGYCNGVSKLHGEVARKMWSHIWPGRPVEEIPITHVTNGVHIPSFISHENSLLFDRYLGPQWMLHPSRPDNVKRIDNIYDEELWRAHSMSRSRLIRACRKLMVNQYKRRNAPKEVIKNAKRVLDQNILTIAFARRFATYKRAHLLLQNPQRFEAILTNKDYPVQFVFAGKAHPRDNEGKELIKGLVNFARNPKVRNRIIFLENYDIHIARHLVQGADVWLNTPRRPLEACGTSGMKAAINGVLNVSVLDGWWCEGYSGERGWRIGNGEEYNDFAYQDSIESQALYNILEDEVIPCFYDRKDGDLPIRWLGMMKESMKMAMGFFCSHRMVGEYDKRFYGPAKKRFDELIQNDSKEAKELARQREKLIKYWDQIRIDYPERESEGPFRVGEKFTVTTVVNLGQLRPDDVEVELFYGIIKAVDSLSGTRTKKMEMLEAHGNGIYLYTCEITCHQSGRYGFTARVTPQGDEWIRFAPGIITWV